MVPVFETPALAFILTPLAFGLGVTAVVALALTLWLAGFGGMTKGPL